VILRTPAGERVVTGTLFAGSTPRLVEIDGIKVEADFAGRMLYIVNEDKPGFIGRLGSVLGDAGVNIGTFHLGRRGAGAEAILLLSVDQPIPEPLMWEICRLPGVRTSKALRFG
jgi:D-3-phosphoglycerate dehydrogenase